MSAAHVIRTGLRCRHCGCEVGETMHMRSAYRVDYYSLHTGPAEPMVLPRGDEAGPAVTVWRLRHVIEIVTCVRCYGDPAVRREREELFRPEQTAAQSPQTAES